MSDRLKRCPLLYDWCSLTYTKLEIILFSFHYRVIRQLFHLLSGMSSLNHKSRDTRHFILKTPEKRFREVVSTRKVYGKM